MNSKIFVYKNTKISYSSTGKGTTLLFLHGFLENKSLWDEVSSGFTDRYRVISVDLLGHGESECLGYVHTMEDQADMLFALISHLRLRKIHIIGHSMGGYVALAFAELYPENVKSISLVNSTSRADSDERKINRDRAIDLVKKNHKIFIRLATQHLFDQDTHKRIPEKIENFTNQALETSLQGVIASLQGMKIRIDREALLYFGPYPKQIIAGTKDTIMKVNDIEDETEGTDVNFTTINCGHVAPLESPDEVIEKLKSFYKTL